MKQKKNIRIDLVPVMALFALLPFVVRMKLVDTGLEKYSWYPNEGYRGDFFMYYRSIVFLILVVSMMILLVDKFLLRQEQRKNWKKFLPLAAYLLLAALSAFFSLYRETAVYGMMEQYETIWVLLGYGITVYFCYVNISSMEEVRLVLLSFGAGMLLECVIGIAQSVRLDFWQSALGLKLILPSSLNNIREQVVFNFSNESIRKVYLSLYNPNYAGVYLTMGIPILAALFAGATKRWQRILWGAGSAAALVCLISTGSKSGYIACLFLACAAMVSFRKSIRRRWKLWAGGLALAAVLTVGYDAALGGSFFPYLKEAVVSQEREYLLQSLKAEKDHIEFVFNGKRLFLSADEEGRQLRVETDRGEEVPLTAGETYLQAEEKGLEGLQFRTLQEEGIRYLILRYEGINWRFTRDTPSGAYTYVNIFGKADTIEDAPCWLFQGHQKLLTFRGYIWGRLLPMWKDCLILGSGPDSFALVFPQNDYLARAKLSDGLFTEILTKAHSMYFQTWIQTGGLSLICLLLFWGSYAMDSIKLYFLGESRDQRGERTGLFLFLGVTGYLIMGITNDSVILVAPLFWGLCGVGMATNEINRDKDTAGLRRAHKFPLDGSKKKR